MRSLLLAFAAAGSLSAPLQCQSDPPAEHRRYERPPEALYELAGRFWEQGQLEPWRMTLQTIIDRYPNSREAVMAKDDLKQ